MKELTEHIGEALDQAVQLYVRRGAGSLSGTAMKRALGEAVLQAIDDWLGESDSASRRIARDYLQRKMDQGEFELAMNYVDGVFDVAHAQRKEAKDKLFEVRKANGELGLQMVELQAKLDAANEELAMAQEAQRQLTQALAELANKPGVEPERVKR